MRCVDFRRMNSRYLNNVVKGSGLVRNKNMLVEILADRKSREAWAKCLDFSHEM